MLYAGRLDHTGALQAPTLQLFNTDFSSFALDNLLLGKLLEKTLLPDTENKPLTGFSCVPYTSKAN